MSRAVNAGGAARRNTNLYGAKKAAGRTKASGCNSPAGCAVPPRSFAMPAPSGATVQITVETDEHGHAHGAGEKPCCAACAAKGPGVTCANGACGVPNVVADPAGMLDANGNAILPLSRSAALSAALSSPAPTFSFSAAPSFSCLEWQLMGYRDQRAALVAADPSLLGNPYALDRAQLSYAMLCARSPVVSFLRPSGAPGDWWDVPAATATNAQAQAHEDAQAERDAAARADNLKLVGDLVAQGNALVIAIINGAYGAQAAENARNGNLAAATTLAQQQAATTTAERLELDQLRRNAALTSAEAAANAQKDNEADSGVKPWVYWTAGGVGLLVVAGVITTIVVTRRKGRGRR